ncbi:phosphatase PAP2 family protein [Caballeronia glebae]|uniref:PAP2 superfamily protein n=1 Tax=Caballeronia glebae TaxID=1777143 RepID=A0A157Z0X4_9BURK|nr:phosphatase PAP2 family protein [Caballeronia glebae]SAK39094.1 PAP2 superfamily protein [Caballeronia glebae]
MYQRFPVLARLLMMLAGWGTVGVCYSIGRHASGQAHLLSESVLDRLIPFDVSAVWLYLSFFAFVPISYLCADVRRVQKLMFGMQLSGVLAAIVFVTWPTTLVYPVDASNTMSATALRLLSANDSPQNCLPSLHGALTTLGMVALWNRHRPMRTAFSLIWAAGIMWSVLQTRRHLAIDLASGAALGLFCAYAVACVGKRSTSSGFLPGGTAASSEIDSNMEPRS